MLFLLFLTVFNLSLGLTFVNFVYATLVIRDIFASITDVIGGRSSAYEEKLAQAREIAIDEMSAQAKRYGANAVVGVDLDYEVIREGMLMVTASGTAVSIA